VKEKKQNITLRQLFRRKLENAEVIPVEAVRSKLMRQVAKQEFMRFIPSKFNIYYLGGILFSGITIAVLVVATMQVSKTRNTVLPASAINGSDTDKYFEVSIPEPERKPVKIPLIVQDKSAKNNQRPALAVKQNPYTLVEKKPGNHVELQPAAVKNDLSEKDLFAQGNADSRKLQTSVKPGESLIQPESSSGCAPFKVRFHSNSETSDSCRWTFGDGGFSGVHDPEWIFDVEGEYKVVLQIFRNDGSTLTSTATVNVHPKPTAHYEIMPEKAILPRDEIHFLNFSTNAVQCKWDFGDGTKSDSYEPSHAYSKFGSYDVRLVVFSDKGCSDSLIVFNAFSGSEYFIDFPNAFIPNPQGPTGGYYSPKSDEAAQVFHPSYSGVSEYQLKVFSKLGIPIFESNDVNSGWDGYHKGQLCEPGVYIWKVRGKYRNGEPFIKMGDITLLKN
jgi:hypothetical protein